MSRPYKATSLKSAEREVRMLRKQLTEIIALLEQYAKDRKLLARLASKTPEFYNPQEAWDAEKLRDKILRNEL